MSTSTVAGLPQYVVLRAKSNGNYLQYQWNDEFGDFYKYMGIRRLVDEVSPFVKIEVVPSTTDTSFVHLKSSYSEKYFQLVQTAGVNFISATAEAPEEDQSKPTCTIFEPVFPSDQPNTVWFRYVPSQAHLFRFNNTSLPHMYDVAIVYSRNSTLFFEYAAWESYEDKMKAKDDAIRVKDEEIQKRKEQVVALELKEKEKKVKLAEEMVKLQTAATSAWDTFQKNVIDA